MKKKTLLLVMAAGVLGLAACQGTLNSSSQGASTAHGSSAGTTSSAAGTSSAGTSSAGSSAASSAASSASSAGNSSSSSSSQASSSSSQEPAKADIAYADDTFVFAGEGDVGGGRFVYWAGDGGSVSKATKVNGTYTLAYASTGNWYGIQIFYKLPYAENNDTYHVAMAFTTDVAGSITVNSNVVSLTAGANNHEFDVTQGSGATISIQLGVATTSSKLGGAAFSFATPVIYDTTANASYDKVEFVNGADVVKSIEVKNGKTVASPADPTPADGYIFDGWYAGNVEYSAAAVITAPVTYTAKFILEADATQYTVTFMNGAKTLGTAKIVQGKKVVVPNTIAAPFGYAVGAWYTDAALTAAWNLSVGTVTGDLTLYAKMLVTPTATFMNTGDTGWKIPSANLSNGSDGSLIVSGFTGWAQASWVVQVNFAPVPTGVTGTNYELSFDYKISSAGGDAQIFDTVTIGSVVTLSVTSTWVTAKIDFAGGVTTSNSKFTFELGALAATSVDFELTNITLVAR